MSPLTRSHSGQQQSAARASTSANGMRARPALRLACGLAAFAAGAASLGLEVVAAGWLAPVHGGGLDAWACVLGVSLGALGVGSLAGAFSAQAAHVPVALTGASLALLLAARQAATLAAPSGESPVGALVWDSIGLLALPQLLLGVLSPWLVERRMASSAGRGAGEIGAIATLGGVAGALGCGLVLVPAVGLSGAARVLSGLLALAALAWGLLAKERRAGLIGCGVALLAQVALWPAPAAPRAGAALIEAVDGVGGRCEVRSDGVWRYLLVDGCLQAQAPAMPMPAMPGELLAAGNALELVPYLRPAGETALAIGLGGGVVARQLATHGWQVEACEIDPRIVDLARRHFGCDTPCVVDDGRRYLARCRRRYDAVVLDVYRGELAPAHLFSAEAFAQMKRVLVPGGVVAVNLIGAGLDPATGAILRAASESFPHLALCGSGLPGVVEPMTLFASAIPIDDPSTGDRLRASGLDRPPVVELADVELTHFARLCDDHNPLASLRRPVARAWRWRSLLRHTPR